VAVAVDLRAVVVLRVALVVLGVVAMGPTHQELLAATVAQIPVVVAGAAQVR
jgi:hypothetical protein